MPRYAVINNGVVVNVIMADSQEIAEEITEMTAIQSDIANIGEIHNEEDDTFFIAPEPPVIEIKIEDPVTVKGK